ncbi:hypothetical protein DdX_02474 [Ditylenchus destructor]|uniref:Edg1 TPR repeats region domain-containing protein n=1 Tax=Ditylenchus destructor TaxID=166010 RepID=A0AAD4RC17_9BILA|nr:hypothetical protein DdX_02474 [Ditylenchus destructor]
MSESTSVKNESVVNWERFHANDDINQLLTAPIDYEIMHADDWNQVIREFYKLNALKEWDPSAFYFKELEEGIAKIKELLLKTSLHEVQTNENIVRNVGRWLTKSPHATAKHIVLVAISNQRKIPVIREIFARIPAFLELRDSQNKDLLLISLYKMLLKSNKDFDQTEHNLKGLGSLIALFSQSKFREGSGIFSRTYTQEPLVSATELLRGFVFEELEKAVYVDFLLDLLRQILQISDDGHCITECAILWTPLDESSGIYVDPKAVTTLLIKLYMQYIDHDQTVQTIEQCIHCLASKLQKDRISFENFDSQISDLQICDWNAKYCVYRWFSATLTSEFKFEIPSILFNLLPTNLCENFHPIDVNEADVSLKGLIKSIFGIGFVSTKSVLEFLEGGLPFQATGSISELIGHALLDALTPTVSVKVLDRTKPVVERIIACLETEPKVFMDEWNGQFYNGLKDMSFLFTLAEAFSLYLKKAKVKDNAKETIELDIIGSILLQSFCNNAQLFVNRNCRRLENRDLIYSSTHFGSDNQLKTVAYLNQLYIVSSIVSDFITAFEEMLVPRCLQSLNDRVVYCMDLFQNKLFPLELVEPLKPPTSESSKNVRYGEVDTAKLKRVESKQTTSNKSHKNAGSTSVNTNENIETGSVKNSVQATETSIPDSCYDDSDDDFWGCRVIKSNDSPKPAKNPVKNKPRNIQIRLGTKVDKYVNDLNGK